jgi:hypothetical protein
MSVRRLHFKIAVYEHVLSRILSDPSNLSCLITTMTRRESTPRFKQSVMLFACAHSIEKEECSVRVERVESLERVFPTPLRICHLQEK